MLFFAPALAATDWPQFQANAARTGWTPDSPAPPYELVYLLDFAPEPMGLVQPIIHGGRLFAPTLEGRLYAFNPADGERLWVAEGLGPVPKTAAAEAGMVYTANLDGLVMATDVASGKLVWKQDLHFAISASPCVENGAIYIGTRCGELFRLDGKTGAIVWRSALDEGDFVWSSAAATPSTGTEQGNGKVYVASDGHLHLYCFDATSGKRLWKSEKMSGMFVRDWCPVVTGGKVIVRTLPAQHLDPEGLASIRPYQVWGKSRDDFMKYYDELYPGSELFLKGRLPDDFEKANDALIEFYSQHPEYQTMFIFDAETGCRPFVAGAFHLLAGWLMPCPPPAVDSEGMLQVVVPFTWCRFGRMNPHTGRICQIIVGPLLEDKEYAKGGGREYWPDGFGTNSDEGHSASCGGDRVFWVHNTCATFTFGKPFAWNVKTGELDRSLYSKTRSISDCQRVFNDEQIRKKVSIAEKERPPSRLHDGTGYPYYTPPAIWGNMIFHHAQTAVGPTGILASRGTAAGGAKEGGQGQ